MNRIHILIAFLAVTNAFYMKAISPKLKVDLDGVDVEIYDNIYKEFSLWYVDDNDELVSYNDMEGVSWKSIDLGLEREEITGVDDDGNDVEMISFADWNTGEMWV